MTEKNIYKLLPNSRVWSLAQVSYELRVSAQSKNKSNACINGKKNALEL